MIFVSNIIYKTKYIASCYKYRKMQSELLIAIVTVCILVLIYTKYYKESFVASQTLITLHYANWCPHCQEMKPVWQAVKKNIQASRSDIIFIENDEEQKQTPGIKDIPTIVAKKSNRIYKYIGGKNYDQLRNWILSL